MLSSRHVDRFYELSLIANLIIQLCLIPRTVLSHKTCAEFFHNANSIRHAGLSRSEYFQMIRSLFVTPSNDTSLESLQDLPFDLTRLFLNFTDRCSRMNVSDCRNGVVDISSDPEEICKSISRVWNKNKRIFSRREHKSSTFKISCEFIVSNDQGILAADLVEGFDAHDDLISALDLTTIKAINIINDTSIAFKVISISLSEVFRIECPKDMIEMGDRQCQAVFAEITFSSISNIELSSVIKRRYEKALQNVINAGFLQEAISLVSNPKQTLFHVENFTQLSLREATKALSEKLPSIQQATFKTARTAIALAENLQPPIIPKSKLKMKRLISTETLSNNFFPPRFVPCIFGLSNSAGLTASNFCKNCSVSEQVQNSFDSLVALIYRHDDNIQLLETRILDVVDTSCGTEAPSYSYCQIVHASYIVNFTNYNSHMEKTFRTLASMTEESIDMGVFQDTVNSIYPDSPLTINSQLVAGLDDVQILNTFVIEVLEGFTALGIDSYVAKILQNAYDALNFKVVENSNIAGLLYVSNSADLFQITEFDCQGSAHSLCCSILASYTVSIDSMRVKKLDIQRRLSSLTESSIADGRFQDILLSVNSSFPLVIKMNDKISGRGIPISQVISVSTSFVLATNTSDSLMVLKNINIGFGVMIENLVNDVNDAEIFGGYQSLKLSNYSLSDVNVYICPSTKSGNECIDVKADFYVVYASSTVDAKRAVTYLTDLTDSLIHRGSLLESIDNQNPPYFLDIVQRRKLTIHPIDIQMEFSISSSYSASIDEISKGLKFVLLDISDSFRKSALFLEESVKIVHQSEVHCPVVGIHQKSSGLIISSVMASNSGSNTKATEKANEKSLVKDFRDLKRGFVNVPAEPQGEFPFQESDMRIERVTKISKGLDSIERDFLSLPETKSLPTIKKELSLETLENITTASGNVAKLHNIFDRDQHLVDPSYFRTRESDNSVAHIFPTSSGNDKGERKCFTIVTSFKSLPVNTSLTAAQIQQYYLENMQSLISRNPSEFALNSDLSLKANGEKDFQRSRSNEVMISNTFSLASRRSFSYSFFQPGGSMYEALKIAFESLVEQVVGKSFFSYHPGSSRIDDVKQTSCDDVFHSDDCYVIRASFTVSVNNKTLINDAKSQLSSFIERGISDGYFQQMLESIDSESPLFVISDFEPTKSLAMRDQAPSGSSWPSGSPSFLPSLHGSSFASMKSMIPSGSSWPSDSPSLLPSLVGSNSASMNSIIPSGSSWPSDMPSSLPSEPGSNSASMNSFIPSSFPSALPSLCPSCSASRMPSIILSTNASDTPSTLASVVPSLLPSSTPSLSPSGSDLPSEIPSQDTYSDGDDSMDSEEGQSSEGTSIGGTNLTNNDGTNVTAQNGTNLSEGASTRPSDNSKDKGNNGGTNKITASKLAGIVVGSLGLLFLLIMLLTWRNRQQNRAIGKASNNDETGVDNDREAGSNGDGENQGDNTSSTKSGGFLNAFRRNTVNSKKKSDNQKRSDSTLHQDNNPLQVKYGSESGSNSESDSSRDFFSTSDLENATKKGNPVATQQNSSNRQRQKEENDKANGSDSYLDSSYSSYLGSESYSYDNSRRRN
jgi:hypothetical protein